MDGTFQKLQETTIFQNALNLFAKTKSELSLRFCPARGYVIKMHLILFDPGNPYFRLPAAFTYARLLPSFLLACCLYFCSLPTFTVARLLPLLLLTRCLYFCSLPLPNFFGGFVKWRIVDRESLYLHFSVFSNTTWRHTCQF